MHFLELKKIRFKIKNLFMKIFNILKNQLKLANIYYLKR